MKKTRQINIGGVVIGGGSPVAVQSMTNSDTADAKATISQILALEDAGCEIVRCTFNTQDCAKSFPEIKRSIHIPLVADVHFDYKLAVLAAQSGADKLRINPGNIGGADKLLEVVKAAKDFGLPIRVGANSGSLKGDTSKAGQARALVDSAMENIDRLVSAGFDDIVISLKASDVRVCVEACETISEMVDFPLHIGVTEAGLYEDSIIKSAIAAGSLLMRGIGDTIRGSVTGDPVREIAAAKKILRYSGRLCEGVEIISCPTCGRCSLDIESIAAEIDKRTAKIKKCLKVAVMGCAVNGPGEAKAADIGVAGGNGEGLLFSGGKVLRKVSENEIISELMELIEKY